MEDIVNNFLNKHDSSRKDLMEKQNDKGNFYYIKTKSKETLVSEILKRVVVNSIASIKWKKSMRWSDTDLLWGRPLRSILAIYNKKILSFSYGHLKACDFTIIEKNLDTKIKKVTNFKDYIKLLSKELNKILKSRNQDDNSSESLKVSFEPAGSERKNPSISIIKSPDFIPAL